MLAVVAAAKPRPYVALLRGINVGGKNVIKMTELRASFEALGFTRVTSYIQSGNVIFHAAGREAGLAATIEAALSARFGYRSSIVLLPRRALERVVAEAPPGFGVHPDRYRYDVLFLKPSLTPAAALAQVKVREGVDEAQAGPRVLYFSRLIARATQSQLARLVMLPIYQSMTIRNWNTTTALLALMAAPASRPAER